MSIIAINAEPVKNADKCFLTNTMHSRVIECVACGTLAAEGAISVDAMAIVTNAWVLHTLIQI